MRLDVAMQHFASMDDFETLKNVFDNFQILDVLVLSIIRSDFFFELVLNVIVKIALGAILDDDDFTMIFQVGFIYVLDNVSMIELL